jgi:hypothetical protein
VHKYREGKVKSTPMRGVKETLKPDAYKQSEPAHPRWAVVMEPFAPGAGGFWVGAWCQVITGSPLASR